MINPRHWCLAITFAAVAGCAPTSYTTRVQRLTRADGAPLLLLSDEPGKGSYPLLVYFDGSGCRSAASAAAFLVKAKDLGYAFATPEKRGVRPGDDGSRCTQEFLDTNDRDLRVADGLALVANARRLFPRWDGRLVLAGGSEGAGVAAAVAARSRETAAVIYLAGGGGVGQADELRIMREKQLQARGASDEERARSLRELELAFDEIRASPRSSRTWFGSDNTFRRWATYLWAPALDDLLKIDAPIYMAHGTLDRSSPIESADTVANEFSRLGRANLVYERLDGLDHGWRDPSGRPHAAAVLKRVGDWLLATVPPR